MSMYKFVKGARLFMQGKREQEDYDNVADTFAGALEAEADQGDIRAVHTYRATEMEGTTQGERYARSVKRGNIRHRTTRTVRKVTTITRGEQSVTSESVMNYSNENNQAYPQTNLSKKNLKFRVVEKVTLSLLSSALRYQYGPEGIFRPDPILISSSCTKLEVLE